MNGEFTRDNWQTSETQPGFLYQPYTHTVVNGKDHFTPVGGPRWSVRFAPQKAGTLAVPVECGRWAGEELLPGAGAEWVELQRRGGIQQPVRGEGICEGEQDGQPVF